VGITKVLPVIFPAAMLAAAVCVSAQEPAKEPAPSAPERAKESGAAVGVPPRLAPTDYPAQAKAGTMTIAAEFSRHAVPTPNATYSTEDFVVVEVALYGPADAHAQLSLDNFSLRISGKKGAIPTQPVGLVLTSLKDPEWVPPDPPAKKGGGTSLIGGGGGGGGQDNVPPIPPKMPFELVRAMNLATQRAELPQGDRPLPLAGLLFFSYHGNLKSISSVDLDYNGPAGKATLSLRP
jgi:hypothetical protein